MGVAKLYPDGGKGGRGKKGDGNPAETAGFSERRLRQARFVLKNIPTLADQVSTGTVTLDSALETAKAAADNAKSIDTRMDELRAEAPDLVELVTEERMKIEEAHAALRARKEEAEREKLAA